MSRSLWLDEALLAESLITRGFDQLAAEKLANTQSAPLLYLYIIKIITLIFGVSEGTLRIFSFFAFLGMLTAEFILLKKVFHLDHTFIAFAVCITTTLNVYMRYSNEFKPYMGDACFVLMVLLMYHLYNSGKLKPALFAAGYCIILLLSSPSLFFIVSVFLIEFTGALIHKDKKTIVKTILTGLPVAVFFMVYYVFWIMPVAEDEGMVNFWEDCFFYFLPPNIGKVDQLTGLFSAFKRLRYVYVVFSIAGFLVSLQKRDRITFVVGLSGILLLIASNFKKYPVVERLWLFSFVLAVMYVIIFLQSMRLKNQKTAFNFIPVVLAFILVINNLPFVKFAGEQQYLEGLEGEDANPLISYVQNNIKEGECLYSDFTSRFVLQFKNGYKSKHIGEGASENIIYGTEYWLFTNNKINQQQLNAEIEKIVDAGRVYILFSHIVIPERINPLLERLQTLGRLDKVLDVHGSLLYYFRVR
jgi:hypothetical protein